MTSIEEHKKAIAHFMDDLQEKIRAGLLVERQKIIGFAASEASTHLLEYFLHKKNVIPAGFKVNHTYFVSEKRAERYVDFNFPKKKEILALMIVQDELRNQLCYGKEKRQEMVKEALNNLQKIKQIIEEELGESL